jgi:hypothetical protein
VKESLEELYERLRRAIALLSDDEKKIIRDDLAQSLHPVYRLKPFRIGTINHN